MPLAIMLFIIKTGIVHSITGIASISPNSIDVPMYFQITIPDSE